MDLINQANSAVTSFFNSSEAFTKNQSSKTNTVQSEAVSSVTHLYYDWGWVIVLHRKEMMSPFSCDVSTFFFFCKERLRDNTAEWLWCLLCVRWTAAYQSRVTAQRADVAQGRESFIVTGIFNHPFFYTYTNNPVLAATSYMMHVTSCATGEKTEGWLTASKWLEAKM